MQKVDAPGTAGEIRATTVTMDGGTTVSHSSPLPVTSVVSAVTAAPGDLGGSKHTASTGTEVIDRLYVTSEETMFPVLVLRQAVPMLRAALEETDDIARLSLMEDFRHAVSRAGAKRSPSPAFDRMVSTLEIALWNHQGRPFTDREIVALTRVVESVQSRPGLKDESWRKHLVDLMRAGFRVGVGEVEREP